MSYPGGCQCHISIHSLRVEGDAVRSASCRSDTHFNPLPPCGGRRLKLFGRILSADFNPLPPCGGRRRAGKGRAGKGNFNPLPPCGGRHYGGGYRDSTRHFNPLPPCGGRRLSLAIPCHLLNFNPLPPCGGRLAVCILLYEVSDFNPLPPCGGRPGVARTTALRALFQSTPSVWRETDDFLKSAAIKSISIHSLRVEGDSKIAQLSA